MNLSKTRLMLAIADIVTLPAIISEKDLAEVKAWIHKESTGIFPQLRDLIEQTLHIAVQEE